MRTSAVDTLPASVRAQLIARAAIAGLARYSELTRWLRARGFSVSRSSLNRALRPFSRELKLLRRAEFLRAAVPSRLRPTVEAALLTVALSDLAECPRRRERKFR